MGNPRHPRPGSLDTQFSTLPDGRQHAVTMFELSNGYQIRADAILPRGSLFSDVEKVDCSGPQSHLANLRLVGGQEARKLHNSADSIWVWVREYEELDATAENLVGGPKIINDEDGRELLELTWLQFVKTTAGVAIPFVRGAKGTAAPGYANTSLAWVQATEDGALRTITRRYDQTNATPTTPDALGPVVISFPFHAKGDAAHVIASQVYEQPASYYTPLTLNATRSVTVGGSAQTLYYIGDVLPPERQGATLLRFRRRWSSIPATRTEPETYAFSYPGYRYTTSGGVTTQGREGFVEVVTSVTTLEFFMVGSGQTYTTKEAIPLIDKQVWIQYTDLADSYPVHKNALDIYLHDTAREPLVSGFTFGLRTDPTRTDYEALVAAGGYPLVAECRIDPYEGNIYVRRTRRVPAR